MNGPVKPLIFTGFLRTLSKMVDIEETVVYVKNRHEQYEAKKFRRITRRTAMIFFIEMYAKKFEQIRKEEKEKIQDKLNLPLIIAFALLVVFIITSFISIGLKFYKLFCVSILINFLLLIIISLISSKRERKYFSNQTNLESSMRALQRLQDLLTENPYIKIRSKQDMQGLYKQASLFYRRKIAPIEGLQKRVLHFIDILIIPAVFAVINFVLAAEEYSFENKFAFTIVLILFALEFLFFFYYIFQMIKTWVEFKNLKFEQFRNALNVLAELEVQDFDKNGQSSIKNRPFETQASMQCDT